MNISADYQNNTYNTNELSLKHNSKTNESNFDLILKEEEKVVEINNKGKLNTFLDKNAVYASLSLSKEDESLFRDILKDDKISLNELKSLPYEKVGILRKLVLPTNLTMNQFNNLPLLKSEETNQVNAMLFATSTTPNISFNKAVYTTLGNISDDEQLFKFTGSLASISQNRLNTKTDAITGIVTKIDIDYSLINFDSFIENKIKNIFEMINNPVYTREEQEKAKIFHDIYLNFQKKYTELKKEFI